MMSFQQERDPTIHRRMILRIRVSVATVMAILMVMTSAAIVVLLHVSDPLTTELGTADAVVLTITATSVVVFGSVGLLLLFQDRVNIVVLRIAEALLWTQLVVLGVSAVGLLATGSLAALPWIAAIGFGFDLGVVSRSRPATR